MRIFCLSRKAHFYLHALSYISVLLGGMASEKRRAVRQTNGKVLFHMAAAEGPSQNKCLQQQDAGVKYPLVQLEA